MQEEPQVPKKRKNKIPLISLSKKKLSVIIQEPDMLENRLQNFTRKRTNVQRSKIESPLNSPKRVNTQAFDGHFDSNNLTFVEKMNSQFMLNNSSKQNIEVDDHKSSQYYNSPSNTTKEK